MQSTIIRKFAQPHFREGMKVLIHSHSSVVLDVLQSLSERGLAVECIVTESRPTQDGMQTNGHKVQARCEELGL